LKNSQCSGRGVGNGPDIENNHSYVPSSLRTSGVLRQTGVGLERAAIFILVISTLADQSVRVS
jgi:hypothetical protein